MLKTKSLRETGDTILEVIIAAAVLTLVLTIAYTAANRGSQSVRQSQERGESSRHTEAQIELLKLFISKTTDPALPGLPPASPAGGTFCMNNNAEPVIITPSPPVNAQDEITGQFATFANPALADCKKEDLYYSYIERNGYTFTAHTRWNRVNGKAIDEVTIVHRIFPDLASASLDSVTDITACNAGFYLNVSLGCTPCQPSFPPNYTTPPGNFLTSCIPIPPRVTVAVKKVNQNPDSTSPACSAPNGLSDKGGSSVSLNGPSYASSPQTTGGAPSSTTFTVPGFGDTYTSSFTPPGGTISGNTNKTGQASFLPCPPANSTATTPALPGGAGSTVIASPELKFYPNCFVRNTPYSVQQPDPATYHSGDVVGYGPVYYTRGAYVNTYYARTGYSGFQYYPIVVSGYPPFYQYGSPHGHLVFGASNPRPIYDHLNIGASHHPGYSGYNIYEAVANQDPIYGPPHYHGTMTVWYDSFSNECPA